MKTALFAWELGDGLGHVSRLVKVAQGLDRAGYRVVFALRTANGMGAASRGLPGTTTVQAPFAVREMCEVPPGKTPPACNYASVLYNCGYDSADTLTELVHGWHKLFETFSPSLIVCDYSPTAVLAAAGRIPAVHIGSGWAIPPSGQPFIYLRKGSEAELLERQSQVLDVIQRTQKATGGPVPDSAPAMLGFAESFACTLPELDPYRAVRPHRSIGPLEILPQPSNASGDKALFGYLNGNYKNLVPLLEGLARAEVDAGIYVRNPPVGLGQLVRSTSVTIYPYPQDLTSALTCRGAILHHGGLSTTETALALGRPQFLLPMHLEQGLTANSVEQLGCGASIGRQKEQPAEFIKAALEYENYSAAALDMAARINSRARMEAKQRVLDACLRHLN